MKKKQTKRLIKLHTCEKDTKIYILELLAARYLWNLGYRCIGFNIYLEPYKRFSVVGIKLKEKSVAIFDIINNKKDFDEKSKNPVEIQEEEKELHSKIAKLVKIYKLQNKTIDFKNDKIWTSLNENLSTIEKNKNKTLYWHMINSFSVATQNWIIGHDKDLENIEPVEGWGIIIVKEDYLIKPKFKTFKKETPIDTEISRPIEPYIADIQTKIAMALTKDVVGNELLKAEKIQFLFKYLSDHEDIGLKEARLDRKIKRLDKRFKRREEERKP